MSLSPVALGSWGIVGALECVFVLLRRYHGTNYDPTVRPK